MLGWCSPQSSVPRQTVGHHAKAAMYEMGLSCPRGLPRRGAQGDPGIPPAGSALFSYTHRPGCSAAHGPAGLSARNPIPQNSFCMRFAKNGLTANTTANSSTNSTKASTRASQPSRSCRGCLLLRRLGCSCLRCLLFSHIPTDQGAVAAPGRRAYGPETQSRKTHCVWVSLKMRSRPSPQQALPYTPRLTTPPNPPTLHPS